MTDGLVLAAICDSCDPGAFIFDELCAADPARIFQILLRRIR